MTSQTAILVVLLSGVAYFSFLLYHSFLFFIYCLISKVLMLITDNVDWRNTNTKLCFQDFDRRQYKEYASIGCSAEGIQSSVKLV